MIALMEPIERDGRTAVLDTETWPILLARKAPKIVCLQAQMADRGPRISTFVEAIEHEMHDVLKHDRIVGYNTSYEAIVTSAAIPSLIQPWFEAYADRRVRDCRLAAQLFEIGHGSYSEWKGWSMDAVASRLLPGFVSHKTDVQVRYWEVDHLGVHQWPDEFKRYALEDVRVTADLDKRIPDQMDETHQAQAAFALHLTSCWGVRTDKGRVEALERQLVEDFETADIECKKIGLVRSDGTKNMTKVQEIVDESWRKQYGEAPPRTKSGKSISTERVVLQGCKNPMLDPYIRRQRAEKGLTTYIPFMRRGTREPICFNFKPLVETGRSSSFEPNGQNIYAFGGFRPCFVPRPSRKFVVADYSINELRCLAQVQYNWFKRSTLGDVIKRGGDPHTELGAEIFEMSVEELEEGLEQGDSRARLARNTAKGPNFGLPGGMGASGLRNYVMRNTGKRGDPIILTVEECARHKRIWSRKWPEMNDYFEKVRGQNGFATVVGTGMKRGGMPFCANCNFHFQALAAAGFKRAHFEVARRQYTDPKSALWGTRSWLALHDELFLEAPEDRAEAAARELEEVMTSEMEKLTPDVPAKVDAKVCDCWEEK